MQYNPLKINIEIHKACGLKEIFNLAKQCGTVIAYDITDERKF